MKILKNIKLWIGLLSIPLVVFGIWLYYEHDPLEHAFFPPCPFYHTTGLHCPGCGSQRALHALLHGDFLGALQNNFLVMLVILLAIFKVVLLVTKKSSTSMHYLNRNSIPWLILLGIVLFWIARNLSFEPFLYLAPY